jgi:polysaccharide export outer membrane protein
MKLNRLVWIVVVIYLTVSSGCKGHKYTSNVMLKTEEADVNWKAVYETTVSTYTIRVADRLQYNIYTNLGEAIIDPTGQLVSAKTAAEGDPNDASGGRPIFEVSEAGTCFFPVIGVVKVEGFTMAQLDSVLSSKYESFYNEVFVISKVINKRVIVLGGRASKVIPLDHPNMSLLEIIALFGGLDNESMAYNIRIVRGDLKNPEITVVNLRTVADMKKSIVRVLPDDIIYIEPVRRPISESAREYMFVFQMVNILFTLTILVERIANR